MKKVALLMIVFAMMFTFVACGDDSSDESESEKKTEKKAVKEEDTVFAFRYNEWNIYVASMLSDSTIKVEKWSRSFADEETPFEYEKDVSTVVIDDENKDGFYWIDKDQTAFCINLHDSDEIGLKKSPSTPFTKTSNKTISSANYTDSIYTYNYDKWNMYVASKLSDSVVKIELWYTGIADDKEYPHEYKEDTTVINVDDQSTDFAWVDDEKTAFTVTLKDASKDNLKSGVKQTFTINKEFKDKFKLESFKLEPTNYSKGSYKKPKTAHSSITSEIREEPSKEDSDDEDSDLNDEDEDDAESDTVFEAKDVSNKTIESIETYGDYLKMYKKITDDYLANYEKVVKGTALYDKSTFESMKKEYDKGFKDQEKEYGSMKSKKIVGKDSLVDYLKEYRDGLKDYIDSLKESL